MAKESVSENERLFRDWLSRQYTGEGIRRYTDTAIMAYAYALRTACYEIQPYVAGNLFYVFSSLEFDAILEKLLSSPDFARVDRESGNGTLSAALKLYQAFLNRGSQSEAPDISAPFYLNQMISHDGYSENRGEEFHYEEVPMTPLQKIYYGVPGTGKSYTVNRILEAAWPEQSERDSHCRRLIFHPTYTYEDFVGSIKPLVTPDRPLDYLFSPGPFTVLLKEAFLNPSETYYLVIEEINRGNAPAIFGDLFQLLDRLPSGKSCYAIQSYDISTFFCRDPGLKNLFAEGKIWLPANFNILATMNTADENIFVLDNAFKRRFTLEYMEIRFDAFPSEWSSSCGLFEGTQSLTELFRGTPLESYAMQLALEQRLNRDWPTFALLTNRVIDLLNNPRTPAGGPGTSRPARIPENKKLGPFFVSKEDLSERKNFINKVLFYLKQDVFGESDHYMTGSYEEIYRKCMDSSFDMFTLLQ